jgi:biopolymer transport protein ExbD
MHFSDAQKPRRKPSLTPMIDVVFLLLVFFMLASRFGTEAVLELPLAGRGGDYSGSPRLVNIGPETLNVNGQPTQDLAASLAPLMETPGDLVILRGINGADLQRITTATQSLRNAGFTAFLRVE